MYHYFLRDLLQKYELCQKFSLMQIDHKQTYHSLILVYSHYNILDNIKLHNLQ
jgi:hypothetical protein